MRANLEQASRHNFDITVVERNDAPGVWSVEIIDYEADGSCYVTVFYGPASRERAEAYAAWHRG